MRTNQRRYARSNECTYRHAYRRVHVAVLLAVVPLLVFATAESSIADALSCKKAVNKVVATLYKTTLQGSEKCYADQLKNGGSVDCLDPAVFDPNDKLGNATAALVEAMTDAPDSACGNLGAGYFLACTDAPAVCAADCACVQGSTGAQIASCLACRVVDAAVGQVEQIYGPDPLTIDGEAQKCLNTIGKTSAKEGRTRMKEQQKCQAAFDANDLRVNCRAADLKGKITKSAAKTTSSVRKACLETPGTDQTPELTGAACTASDVAGAIACASDEATEAVNAIFDLASAPGSIFGFVTIAGADGMPLPLRGVRIEIAGTNVGTKTDVNGFYLVEAVPPGHQTRPRGGGRNSISSLSIPSHYPHWRSPTPQGFETERARCG